METVLIVGASAGIGLATAQLLAQNGYRVFGTARSLQKRADVTTQAEALYGERLRFIEMDVTQDASVKKGVAEVIRQAGGIDILICNAGIGVFGSIEEMPLEQMIRQFDVNVFGYLRVVQAVLPPMREKRAGRMVLVSSVGGVVAIPYEVPYSATKYAVDAITEGLRQELRGFGIKVSAVRPGDIRTCMHDETPKLIPQDSPYKPWSKKCLEAMDRNMESAPEPVLVAKTIHRILKKRNPAAYYTAADFLTSLTPLLTPLMPSKLKEKVVRMFYHMDF